VLFSVSRVTGIVDVIGRRVARMCERVGAGGGRSLVVVGGSAKSATGLLGAVEIGGGGKLETVRGGGKRGGLRDCLHHSGQYLRKRR
jgi:hypothetical protein